MNNIQSILVKLQLETGKLVPFPERERGEVVLTLKFQRFSDYAGVLS